MKNKARKIGDAAIILIASTAMIIMFLYCAKTGMSNCMSKGGTMQSCANIN